MDTTNVVESSPPVERRNGNPKKGRRAEAKPNGKGHISVSDTSNIRMATLAPLSPELIDALTDNVGGFFCDPPRLHIIRAEAWDELQARSSADVLTERQLAELQRGHPVAGKKKAFIVTDEAHRQIARRFHELRSKQAEEMLDTLRTLFREFPIDDPERRMRLEECAHLSGMSKDTVKQYCQYEGLPVIRRDTRLKKGGAPGLPSGKTSAWRVKRKDLLKHLDQKTEVLR